jgi:hypothetical protein
MDPNEIGIEKKYSDPAVKFPKLLVVTAWSVPPDTCT